MRDVIQAALHRLSGEPETPQTHIAVGMESGIG
jgi:hypothetical protein